jgi:uncharacterized protein
VGNEIAPRTDDEYDALADIAVRVRQAFRYAERPTRFVFGTDWPLIPIAAYKRFIAEVIPERCHPMVFAENARTLFRLG